jgi:predicted ester cyclase
MLEKGAAGDFEALRQYIDPEFVTIEADSLPYPGSFFGFDGYMQIMRKLFETWQDLRWDILGLIADGDSIAVRLVLHGRRGSRTFSMPVCEIWEFRNAKVFRATPYYFDTKLLADLFASTQQSQ